MRTFLHFGWISNFEAFTFVNRESALRSCVLHEYVELVPNVIMYTVYTRVVYLTECFLQLRMLAVRNVSKTVATWLARQNHDLGETFSIHSLTFVPSGLIFHSSFFLPLTSPKLFDGRVESMCMLVDRKNFCFLPFSFTSALGDYIDWATSSINLKEYSSSAPVQEAAHPR